MKAYRGKGQEQPQLTDKGKGLATTAREAMQAMERGDMAQFIAIAAASPELTAIFAENDQKTACAIVMLLDLGHDERVGPRLSSETARPGSWLVDLDRNYDRLKRASN